MITLRKLLPTALALLIAASGLSSAVAQDLSSGLMAGPRVKTASPVLRSWMSPDIGQAWNKGYTGKGTTLTFIDDFTSSSRFSGNLGTGSQTLRHGEWTRLEGSMVAPGATIVSRDFRTGTTVPLGTGLNVMNMSYGMYASAQYSLSQIGWSAQESSLISYAGGRAVMVKAAGNDSVSVGAANASGNRDFLNLALVGKTSAIFVGALTTNGTTTAPASMASYSNTAGSDITVQNQFLVVGVESSKTGLAGTSFAAPIVAGYASILGNKFPTASATQITNQLLTTARTDTLLNFNAATYGRGEASLTRALAPISIR